MAGYDLNFVFIALRYHCINKKFFLANLRDFFILNVTFETHPLCERIYFKKTNKQLIRASIDKKLGGQHGQNCW